MLWKTTGDLCGGVNDTIRAEAYIILTDLQLLDRLDIPTHDLTVYPLKEDEAALHISKKDDPHST